MTTNVEKLLCQYYVWEHDVLLISLNKHNELLLQLEEKSSLEGLH